MTYSKVQVTTLQHSLTFPRKRCLYLTITHLRQFQYILRFPSHFLLGFPAMKFFRCWTGTEGEDWSSIATLNKKKQWPTGLIYMQTYITKVSFSAVTAQERFKESNAATACWPMRRQMIPEIVSHRKADGSWGCHCLLQPTALGHWAQHSKKTKTSFHNATGLAVSSGSPPGIADPDGLSHPHSQHIFYNSF